MNKKVKWGIYAVIGIGLIGMAIHSFLPKSNPDLLGHNKHQAPAEKH